jgi:DNA-binding response OmpR family regulator
MHVLIIEDDIDLGQALLASLRLEGISGVWVRSLREADAFVAEAPDCVLLDLALPDGEGLERLRRWREAGYGVPIIVITARTALEDRVSGLDGGADDFLTKPFAMAELISRLHAVTRRHARQASECWRLGDLVIEPRTYRVWLSGAPVDLSPREFRLLAELARDPDAVVSKSILGQRLEPLGDPLDVASIEVHLSNLRRKIGAGRIRTVRGVGYQLLT